MALRIVWKAEIAEKLALQKSEDIKKEWRRVGGAFRDIITKVYGSTGDFIEIDVYFAVYLGSGWRERRYTQNPQKLCYR